MAVIFDFQMPISQMFEELQGWNLNFKLITPQIYYWNLFWHHGGHLGFCQKAIYQLVEEL